MGMYDTIKIKKALPLPEEVKHLNLNWLEIEYQTKNFDNCLSEFVLTENGELFEILVEREYVEWSNEEKKTAPKFSFFKDIIEKKREEKKLNYHGVVRFYCYERFDEENDFFIDYDAFFIYGKLDKIEIAKFEKYKASRNNMHNLFLEHNKFKNKLKRSAAKYSGWNWFWKSVTKLLYNTSSLLEKMRVIIFNYLII
jgi:hypothetical protein